MTVQRPKLSMSDAATTLADWIARGDAVRLAASAAEPLPLEAFASKTGMEVYAALLQGGAATLPIAETLDFMLVEVELGRVVFQGLPQRKHFNPLGTIHGGWISTLLDSAMASAIHTQLPAGKAQTTVELKVNFVRALTDKIPLIRAEGKTIHLGRRIGTSEGRLYGPDGTLYAHGTTTCLVIDMAPGAAPGGKSQASKSA